MKIKALSFFTALILILCAGCAVKPADVPEPSASEQVSEPSAEDVESVYVGEEELPAVDVAEEAEVIAEAPEAALPDILTPEASGELVAENEHVRIDYSNVDDGYIMVLYSSETSKRLKVQIEGPETTYTYNLYQGEWAVYPITDGNGYYKFMVYRNVTGNQYSLVLGKDYHVTLADEFAPFIRPNQFVNYSESTVAVDKAYELTKDIEDPLDKVTVIYDYVVTTLSYDKEKARTVKSGYLCDMDEILESGKGICFDYAAVMTGMLRSQGIPCKMVFGYAGKAYHAWISVWTEEEGWVDGAIFFDGTTWMRMDPTFASSADRSESIMNYIGNGKNYTEKYLY